MFIDTIRPSISNVSLKSNNIYNDALAVINDTITLTFTLSEKLYKDPSVYISSKKATVTKSGLNYAAYVVVGKRMKQKQNKNKQTKKTKKEGKKKKKKEIFTPPNLSFQFQPYLYYTHQNNVICIIFIRYRSSNHGFSFHII